MPHFAERNRNVRIFPTSWPIRRLGQQYSLVSKDDTPNGVWFYIPQLLPISIYCSKFTGIEGKVNSNSVIGQQLEVRIHSDECAK